MFETAAAPREPSSEHLKRFTSLYSQRASCLIWASTPRRIIASSKRFRKSTPTRDRKPPRFEMAEALLRQSLRSQPTVCRKVRSKAAEVRRAEPSENDLLMQARRLLINPPSNHKSKIVEVWEAEALGEPRSSKF
ncbi:hypothetical protein NPIL_75841 [Nephila pilipes]|uniref:Uncharacterized protein n=1 Tax=Nephila pilipes TaxID=299642 RepID=A0A8X6U5B3_NEPPI|nr:hypothetical protein NPIL_75841 [Nephila pilipes]